MPRPNFSSNPDGFKGRPNIGTVLDEATRLLIDGKTSRAERILRKLLKAEPDNAEGLHLAGVARHRAGKLGQAADLVEKAIHAEPEDERFHMTLGHILSADGQVERAAACYRQGLTAQPNLVPVSQGDDFVVACAGDRAAPWSRQNGENPLVGYVYLAKSPESPSLLKIGCARNDPRTSMAQPRTGKSQGLRLVHAIAVPYPKEIERQIYGRFAAARREGDWFQVSVSEARRALYTMAEHAAPVDAQSELNHFIRDLGGSGVGSGAYILVVFSLIVGLGVSVAAAASLGYIWWLITDDTLGKLFLLLMGLIIGFPAGLTLAETIGDKTKRTIFSRKIMEESRRIEKEYEENFSIKVFLN